MMKFNFLLSILLTILCIIFSCTNPESFDVPKVICKDANLKTNITVDQFQKLALSSAYRIADEQIVEGFVVSSDQSGNFFKTLSIVSRDGKYGINVALDRESLHTFYEPGRQVFIKAKGLTIGKVDDEVELGIPYNGGVGRISNEIIDQFLFRGCQAVKEDSLLQKATLPVMASQLNTLIEIDNIQFVAGSRGATYFNPSSTAGSGTNHYIEDEKGNKLLVRMSEFASFSKAVVPEGIGKIKGVLQKFGSDFQLIIRDTSDVKVSGKSAIWGFSPTPITGIATQIKALRDSFANGKTSITENFFVEGIVTLSPNNSNNTGSALSVYIQDNTAGILLRTTTASALREGYKIRIGLQNALLSEFRGLLQLSNINPQSKIEMLDAHAVLPDPIEVSIQDAMSKKYESRLVAIKNVQFTETPLILTGSTYITDGKATALVYTQPSSTFAGLVAPSGNGTFVGVVSTFDNPQLLITDKNTFSSFTQTRMDVAKSAVLKDLSYVKDLASSLAVGKNTIVNENIIVKGVVISNKTTQNIQSQNVIIQDATAGILFRFNSEPDVNLGDEISVGVLGATLENYNGLLQVNNLQLTKITQKTKGTLPEPKKVSLAEIANGKYQSELVYIDSVQFVQSGTFVGGGANTSLEVNDCHRRVVVFIRKDATFGATTIDQKRGKLVAIPSAFNNPQLYIRDEKDVQFTLARSSCINDKDLKYVRDLATGLSIGAVKRIDESFSIKAVVTSDASKKNIHSSNVILQDATAGISLWFNEAHTLNLGDEVEIQILNDTIENNRGLIQLSKIALHQIASTRSGAILPTPKLATLKDINDGKFQSELVSIEDVEITQTGNYVVNNANTTLTLRNCTEQTNLLIRFDATFATQSIPRMSGKIVAIPSSFNTPQLYIRDVTDVNFTSPLLICEKAISYLRSLGTNLQQGATTTITESISIKGVVTSNRTTANLPLSEVILQDASGGIALQFSANHNLDLGMQVVVNMNGASLMNEGGLLKITGLSLTNIAHTVSGTLPTAKTVTLAHITSGKYQAELVTLSGVQFFATGTYIPNAKDTIYRLGVCNERVDLLIRKDASFANNTIPQMNGTITGIPLSHNGSRYLYLRDENDIQFSATRLPCLEPKDITFVRNLGAGLAAGASTTITDNISLKAVVISDRTTMNLPSTDVILQDAVAGIIIRFDGAHSLNLGQEADITVTNATITNDRGLLRISGVPLANITATRVGALPKPQDITLVDIDNLTYQSELVRITDDVQFFASGNYNQGGTKDTALDLGTCNAKVKVFIAQATTFGTTAINTMKGTLTGIPTIVNGKNGIYIRSEADINFLATATVCNPKLMITEIADPLNISTFAGTRFIELYNSGTSPISLNGWKLIYYAAPTTVNPTLSLNLNNVSVLAGGFYIISNSIGYNTYSTNGNSDQTHGTFAPTGDEVIELRDNSNILIDYYGVKSPSTPLAPVFTDGYARRKTTVTQPNPTFDVNEWEIVTGGKNFPADFTPRVR